MSATLVMTVFFLLVVRIPISAFTETPSNDDPSEEETQSFTPQEILIPAEEVPKSDFTSIIESQPEITDVDAGSQKIEGFSELTIDTFGLLTQYYSVVAQTMKSQVVDAYEDATYVPPTPVVKKRDIAQPLVKKVTKTKTETQISETTNYIPNVDTSYSVEIPEDYPHAQFIKDHRKYDDSWTELDMLACQIYTENGGDGSSDFARHLVGEVIVNRVKDSRFPNTMYEVLMAPRQYADNSYNGLRWPKRASNVGELHAVERAYVIAQDVLDGNRLSDKNLVWQAGFSQGTLYVKNSNTYFGY
jgi:hypothetical protein